MGRVRSSRVHEQHYCTTNRRNGTEFIGYAVECPEFLSKPYDTAQDAEARRDIIDLHGGCFGHDHEIVKVYLAGPGPRSEVDDDLSDVDLSAVNL